MLRSRTNRSPTNGIELHVAAAGPADGPPVILCHGFPELWYSWRHQLGALGDAGYRALAPDLRGYGGSSAPKDVAAYGSDQLTGDLCGLLDHYGWEKAAFSGHDWGAMVVWEMGRLHPERVASIYAMSVPYSQAPGPPTEVFATSSATSSSTCSTSKTSGRPRRSSTPTRAATCARCCTRRAARAWRRGRRCSATRRREGTKFLDILQPAPDVLPDWLTEHDVDVYTEGLTRSGLFGPLSFYRNLDANWARSKDLPASIYTMPSGFLTGSLDPVVSCSRARPTP